MRTQYSSLLKYSSQCEILYWFCITFVMKCGYLAWPYNAMDDGALPILHHFLL